MTFDFSAFKNKTAAKNDALLKELDIKLPTAFVPLPTPKKKATTATPKKEKKVSTPSATPTTGAAQVAEREAAGLRSSPRVRNSLLGLTPVKKASTPSTVAIDSDSEAEEDYYEGGKKVKTTYATGKLGVRKYDPKRYGNIPGVPCGRTYGFREEASTDSIHAPFVAGISGGPQGAYSICVSGGYEGDVDLGERLTFSGAGGRALKGTAGNLKNLRTAPQSSDQSWETPLNAALLKSVESKKPIRVLRGYKGKSNYAPAEGYRYDGLYQAVKHWQDVGDAGYKICRVALVRLGGQVEIPKKDDGAESDTSASASGAASLSDTPATSPEPVPKKRKRAGSTAAADKAVTAAEKAKRRKSTRF